MRVDLAGCKVILKINGGKSNSFRQVFFFFMKIICCIPIIYMYQRVMQNFYAPGVFVLFTRNYQVPSYIFILETPACLI